MARDEEVVQARSGYLPTLDLIAGAGVEDVQEPVDETYDPMQVTLKLRQNVFAGFSTKNEVARQKHRVRSMAYTLQATSENVALKAAKVYLEVLRNQELKALADQNLLKHQQIADQIGLRTESGVGSQVDSEQVRGRLALAQSNVVVTQTNLLDAMTNYQGIMGRLPGDLIKPEPPVDGMPASLEEAEKWAVDNHPTLKSAGADLDARHKQRDVANWTFMPIVDLELDQNWEDEVDQIDEEQQSTVAMVRLRYNLFNGLKDRGRKAETVQLVEEAREIKNNTHRQVIESIRLSWMAYQSVLDRIKYLEDHVQMTAATATAFSKQFDIGKRTLLDVLDTEAEAIDARRDLINASYDGLYSQYRILNGTGGLVHSFGLKWPEESIVEEEENETEKIQDEGNPQTGGINQIRVGEMMVAGN
ncbi:TolC family outer membrane protein [Desulfoprunum benzoelyticum]|uniref:TolC family outer membrane protein n=1 Tax=Desulfoprunum benzoelyticum TaxID=1506996 RepID=UPI001F0536B4|nr:TolC family outer membrane protein [Desulfoprunum benzoelyticum]